LDLRLGLCADRPGVGDCVFEIGRLFGRLFRRLLLDARAFLGQLRFEVAECQLLAGEIGSRDRKSQALDAAGDQHERQDGAQHRCRWVFEEKGRHGVIS
jgi:hypothetical protein